MAKPKFRRFDFDRNLAHADFAGERMGAAVAALRGIAHAQQKPFVAARQSLQAHVAVGRETSAARASDRRVRASGAVIGLQQALLAQDVGHPRHRLPYPARRAGARATAAVVLQQQKSSSRCV